ncbi:Kazal-like serine protease inhibitor [Phytophthora megakarya]|uniref:Kazal-like serine protease inhibitor n=1 Tax=Phytophthora megakarya TaxID=4795 RepID=A0A225UJT4_9STRA|nr:Kazal-like serine protease inhibitor [Phytophthora megakarya]
MKIATCLALLAVSISSTVAEGSVLSLRKLADCDFECPENLAFVCGTNDQSYTNECYLRRDSCKRPELNIKVKLNEECPSPPPEVGVVGSGGQ